MEKYLIINTWAYGYTVQAEINGSRLPLWKYYSMDYTKKAAENHYRKLFNLQHKHFIRIDITGR